MEWCLRLPFKREVLVLDLRTKREFKSRFTFDYSNTGGPKRKRLTEQSVNRIEICKWSWTFAVKFECKSSTRIL